MSIWKALVAEEEAKWNLKALRSMGTYEMADWLRSMRLHFLHFAPDFNVETLVQIIYDKELTGRQLNKEEVKPETFANWFRDWNQLQHGGPETVSPDTMNAVIHKIFKQFKMQKDTEKDWTKGV